MRLVWSEEAVAALDALELDLAERFPQQVDDIIDRLVERVCMLETNPELGRAVPEFRLRQVRELVDSHNRVLYWVRNDVVEVLTIVPTQTPIFFPGDK